MPHTELHKAQRRKNLTLLVVLVALMFLLFAISLMKMKAAA